MAVELMQEDNKCGKCGKPSEGPHRCPYQAALHDDNDPEYCTCCEDCTTQCRNDI